MIRRPPRSTLFPYTNALPIWFVIGALTTLRRVAEHPGLRAAFPALGTAAGLVSSPQLRNMGTIGGNGCVGTRWHYYNQTQQWREGGGVCPEKDGDNCLVAPRRPPRRAG